MTNKKISQLTAGTPLDTDFLPYVDGVTMETKKALKSDLEGTDGNGIDNITLINTVGLVKTYRITYTDATTFDYDVTDGSNGTNGTDGNGIVSITLTGTVGLVDTYQILFDDATTFDYTVTNGADGAGDMNKSTYDPQNIVGDAFLRSNHTGNQDLTSVALKIPNGTAPVVNADGEIAIDTSVSGLSHGIIRYYATEEVFNLPLPVAQLAALNNGYIPKFNASTSEFELVAETTGGGDTITTTVNTIKKDSTSGTSDTYGVLAGAVDGVNTTYTGSTSIYVSGTLTVYRNGVRQIQGISEDWTETTPASGIFDFNTAPLTGDVIDVEYSNQDVTASALIAEKDVTSKSTNYTVLSTDRIVLVNAASGNLTITLPATTDIDTIGVTIKKIDTSGNTVTIATPGAETIDNSSTYVMLSPFDSRTLITDSSNYFIK